MTDCVHHWKIGEPKDGRAMGICTLCKANKEFTSTPPVSGAKASQERKAVNPFWAYSRAREEPGDEEMLSIEAGGEERTAVEPEEPAKIESPSEEPQARSQEPAVAIEAQAGTEPKERTAEMEPEKTEKRSRAFFVTHKDEILDDYRALGPAAMRKKWAIASSTWTQLKRRWDLPGREPKSKSKAKVGSMEAERGYWRGYRQAILDISGARRQ